jgi:AraC-like DNA-binding protein
MLHCCYDGRGTSALRRVPAALGDRQSSFAQRFTAYVQIPPMQYLGRWLQLAASQLETGTLSVGQAASAVGYQSEAAFNRAFKREVGEAPGLWRRQRLRSAGGGPAPAPEVSRSSMAQLPYPSKVARTSK